MTVVTIHRTKSGCNPKSNDITQAGRGHTCGVTIAVQSTGYIEMSNKADRVYYEWVQSLSQAGWDVDKADTIKFNSGSETGKHQHAKLATAHILRDAGYRIDTEVTHPERGEIDVISIPTKESQEPFAVELETSPTPETTQDKLERYHNGTPFVECYIVNLAEVGTDVIEMRKDIQMQL